MVKEILGIEKQINKQLALNAVTDNPLPFLLLTLPPLRPILGVTERFSFYALEREQERKID